MLLGKTDIEVYNGINDKRKSKSIQEYLINYDLSFNQFI